MSTKEVSFVITVVLFSKLFDTKTGLPSNTWSKSSSEGIINSSVISRTSDNKIYATATLDISYHVIKANILDYGDTNAYRFRIRGINNQSNIPGQVSDVSFALIRPIGEPGIVPVADISGTNGFHVRLKRNGDDHYLKFIVPATDTAPVTSKSPARVTAMPVVLGCILSVRITDI